MIVFDRNQHGQSRPLAERTITPSVRDILTGKHADASVIGLIGPTGWPLAQAWQACLDEGRTPIILHYPTPKLSRIYWKDEIEYGIKSVGVQLLICENEKCVPAGIDIPVLLLDECEAVEDFTGLNEIPARGSIIQMSSGTTGYRKGIEFKLENLHTHVAHFNEKLKLTSEDCIVSWLPLYHDMGFIAAFIMPRILGCKVVMMDPIDWVRQPEQLWDMVDQHHGTVCYMPNFGFEVMASKPRPAPTMRKWISCSEPTRRQTMERFTAATGTPLGAIANCWGMAENIFAVCMSDGIVSRTIDGTEVVSCGATIPHVDIKCKDGEVFVRSPYSLREYIGAPLEIDEDGYYPSGDLGVIEDGQLYLLGRKHDVLVVAGRKSLASDLDFMVADEVPESAGRIATFSVPEEKLGTDLPVILIEHAQFWRKGRDADLVRRITARVGIESAQVHFVPPRFITKTSSGKINRKATRSNWLKRVAASSRPTALAAPPKIMAKNAIEQRFPWLDFAQPLRLQIDSLGYVNLRLMLEPYGVANRLTPEMTLDEVLAIGETDEAEVQGVISIVSLTDANVFRVFANDAIETFSAGATMPVHFKHLCVPALPVLLSDIIFHDYFMMRDERGLEPYASFLGVISDLRSANVLIIDEAAAAYWPTSEALMSYPQLSHDFQSDPAADLMGVRWARYTENHNQLASKVVDLREPGAFDVNAVIAELADYLGIPVVRVAYGVSNRDVTAAWEVQGGADDVKMSAAYGNSAGLDLDRMKRDLISALEAILPRAPRRLSVESSYINWSDQPHWCSWTVNPALVDFILTNFRAPIVLGKPGSVPYLSRLAAEKGIPLRFHLSLQIPDDCDCVIMTGAWGRPITDKPIFSLMAAGWETATGTNVPADLEASVPPARVLA